MANFELNKSFFAKENLVKCLYYVNPLNYLHEIARLLEANFAKRFFMTQIDQRQYSQASIRKK